MKGDRTVAIVYTAMLILFISYMSYLDNKYNNPPPATKIEAELIDRYGQYKSNPFVAIFCRRTEWLTKLYGFQQSALRVHLQYSHPEVKRWSDKIAEMREKVEVDRKRLREYDIEPLPSADDCNYIW